ncbi:MULTISPECIES: KH domain-containing protein [Limnochorda]|uniref:KH domain-containing protein n=1 Tax=Limnochorda TaxID=1676651 RepID=UPI0017AED4E6|nr:KH domain-containing protein [Limnochorda pilosa]MBO2487010.1 RNA-binding protein [Bacillota bacterium]MBO2518196.1 RNA-binding protein [Bacillota bacterium]NMA70332.1 KH domain-containing protein [Bacillota bacterium]
MDETGLVELVRWIAVHLVDHPDDVKVSLVRGEAGKKTPTVLELRVHPDDMGQVIGKQGRVANAIRTLLKAASGRGGEAVRLEILE